MATLRLLTAAAGIAASLSASAQVDPRPLEFERVEIQPAPVFGTTVDATPLFQFVDSDASLVGSYWDSAIGNVSFRQRVDGSGFESLGQLWPAATNARGGVAGFSGHPSRAVGALSLPGQPLRLLDAPMFRSSQLAGVSEGGLAVGSGLLEVGREFVPFTWDGDVMTMLPLPSDALGGAAIGISPDGRTVVGRIDTDQTLADGQQLRRIVTWVDGELVDTSFLIENEFWRYERAEVSNEGLALFRLSFPGEIGLSLLYDLADDTSLYDGIYPGGLFDAAGISEDGLIAVNDRSGLSPDENPTGLLGPDGFVPIASLTDDPVELTFFRDWDPTGSHLLAFEIRDEVGVTAIYTRIPAPGVLVALGGAALIGVRRRR